VALGGREGFARRYLEAVGTRGPWRLAVRIPRQAAWKQVAPGTTRLASGDFAAAILMFLLLTCVI